jgi:hypothetical protein
MSRRRIIQLSLAGTLALVAGCGDPEISRPARAVQCPADVPARRAFDARAILGLPERKAADAARREGCSMVVAGRDGGPNVISAKYDPRRLVVEVDDGIVTRIVGVY